MGVKRESKELVDQALQGGMPQATIGSIAKRPASTRAQLYMDAFGSLKVAMHGLSSRLGKPEWGCRCCCCLDVDSEP